MRIVFLGTPAFAVPSLEALIAQHEVIAAFTQPDRPAGRSRDFTRPPVKISAERAGIPVHQPQRIRRPENLELLRALAPELMVVVGYGQLIPQSIIDIPPRGILNVHASLLPKYRGAAPIQWALARGESETGVTIMQIDAGLDTGDMLLKASLAVGPDELAPELGVRLASLGSNLLTESIGQLETGASTREKQNDAEATFAPILKKEDGSIDWSWNAAEIYNRLRGFTPWPGIYTFFRGQPLQIRNARPAESSSFAPGRLHRHGRRLLASAGGNSVLELFEVQPAGKNRMSAEAFFNGYRPTDGERLGENA